jgi:hypothetical protein
MQAGKITSLSERGFDADLGRHRLTFFSKHRRFRLVIDDSGAIIQRSALDFGDAPLPKADNYALLRAIARHPCLSAIALIAGGASQRVARMRAR